MDDQTDTRKTQMLEKAEQRKLRKQYRKKLETTEQKRAELVDSNTDILIEELEEANKLFENVTTTYEASLDSRLLLISAVIGEAQARKLKLDSIGLDIDQVIKKARIKLFGHNPDEREAAGIVPDWGVLGKIASKFSKRVPGLDSLSGPLNADPPKPRAIRKTRNLSNGANTSQGSTKVNELNKLDFSKQINETTKRVKQIHSLLQELGSIHLFEFVINPHSFAETVENVFYLSFLIRDGKAYIDDESGQPLLAACEPPDQEAYKHGLVKKQVVFDIDMTLWEQLIDVYSIENSIIPARNP
ncbi:hypothetical protein BB561_006186 [Smittium simulii]|uniref:Non-structural maintenance of chromosomes element 4 n=1 Tax=Smittium simulii TaxID=133385 RepID=A0A2T9Y623_9FUNG|nr:hypothetical protein BB561_006186 [Smittium simulii]